MKTFILKSSFNMILVVPSSVSNGTGFSCPWDKGREVFSYPGTKGQQDKLKILHRPRWHFDILPRDGPGQDFYGLSRPLGPIEK